MDYMESDVTEPHRQWSLWQRAVIWAYQRWVVAPTVAGYIAVSGADFEALQSRSDATEFDIDTGPTLH